MTVETICQHSLAATIRKLASKGMRNLLVTSSSPREGKSSVAADLAMSLAESGGESVALVDADRTPWKRPIEDGERCPCPQA